MSEGRERFEELLETTLSGASSAEVFDELATLVAGNAELRRAYVAQMRMHALLQWRSGKVDVVQASGHGEQERVIEFPTAPARPQRAVGWLALAATILVLCGLAAVWLHQSPRSQAELAVLEAEGATWSDGRTIKAGDRIRQTKLDLAAGRLRFSTSAGALVSVAGPARLEVVNSMRLRVLTGRVTADVPERAHGFTIETADAQVVDLGTRFGVEAGADGRTSVVVFDGKVDVAREGTAEPKRLVQGEAVRLENGKSAARIENVHRGTRLDDWSLREGAGLIRLVRDNLRAGDSAKFYEIVERGLVEDTRAYVDRDHQWNGMDAAGLPEFLRGADLVRTFNDDKRATDLEVAVELARPATLYLFLDKKPPPAWVASAGFADTGARIGLDEGPSASHAFTTATGPGVSIERVFSIWKLEVRAPRAVQLGPPREGPSGAKAMYGIAASSLAEK
jgi:FecR protein